MSAHTPAPWAFVTRTVYALHGNPPRNRFTALLQSGRRDDAGEAELLANARLIAAAPDLLAALQRQVANIERWLEAGAPADAAESKSIYEQMVSAIARATEPTGENE